MLSPALHVIVGSTEARDHLIVLRRCGWGRMFIDRRPKPYPGERWGFDNGAYTCWTKGLSWDAGRWQKHLDRAYLAGIPFLAVLPDVVAGGVASLDFSMSWIDRVPADWPWFLAVQDGMTPADVEPFMPLVSGLFLGGSNDFKVSAPLWATLAHSYGKLFHYARAGTYRKMRHARFAGADSIDSAFPLWKKERLAAFEGWWKTGETQQQLYN